jgi:hypothetical protein
MDLTQFVLLSAVLVGVNQLIRLARAKDWWGVVTVLSAALVGAVFGALGLEGLDVVHGLAVGFGSVGSMTALSHFGSGNTVTPNSDPVVKE